MSLFDFLTDGTPPAHHRPVRNVPYMQPIGDCGTWECTGCGYWYKRCRCLSHEPYDAGGAW